MAQVLPRALFILIAWTMTCVLIRNLWPGADPITFSVAGVVWIAGGIGYFSYLDKLRRDIDELERRCGIHRRPELEPVENPAAE